MNNLPVIDRGSPTASFASECSDNSDYEDDDENENEYRLVSPPPSDLISKASASTTTIKSNNSLIKKYASQSRTDISSISISPLLLRKQRQSQCIPSTLPPKPPVNSSISRLNRFPDRKINPNDPQSQLGARNVNRKSQTITYTTIIQTPRKTTNGRTSTLTLPKESQLNAGGLNRLYQLILEQMHQLCIRYPNKTADETQRICHEVVENWNKYRNSIGDFWLSRLDGPERQAITQIVWTNVQRIIKQICTIDEPIEQLSLSKHLIKLEQRLLSSHGQCLWDICQNRHNSWSATLMSNTVRLSPIELSCCNRFVELCKQALFVVYRYSTDNKTEKQRQQQTEGTTVAVIG